MSIGKRIGILFIATLLGACVGYLVAIGLISGFFVQWQTLEASPEKATKIVTNYQGGLWIETVSNTVYEYSRESDCGSTCWSRSVLPEPDPQAFTLLCPPEYDPALPLNTVATQQVCTPWGPGYIHDIYALREDGAVSLWEHRAGEDTMDLITFPFIFAIIFLVGAVFVVLVLQDHYKQARERQKISNSANQ